MYQVRLGQCRGSPEGGGVLEEKRTLKHPRSISTKAMATRLSLLPCVEIYHPQPIARVCIWFFLIKTEIFLCRQASQLGNSFYVPLNSFCCRQKPRLTLFVSFQCLSFSSLFSPLLSPTPSSALPLRAGAHCCSGWTFNPGVLPTPSTEPAFAPGI